MRHWRIHHQIAVGNFLRKEMLIVLIGGMDDRIVLRLIGLYHNLPGKRAPARPARRLCEQLKGALSCPVISCMERHIRCQNAHQRNLCKIMSLHDHLCADKDVRLLMRKLRQNLLIAVLALGRICIHSRQARRRKLSVQKLLNLLCARPESKNIF